VPDFTGMDDKKQGNYSAPIKRGGRPKKPLRDVPSIEFITQCAKFGIPQERIAESLGITSETIRKNADLYDAWKRGHADACIDIHKAQFHAGVRQGNVTMLIWLGKQYLGQADKQEVSVAQEFITPEDRMREAHAALQRIRQERAADREAAAAAKAVQAAKVEEAAKAVQADAGEAAGKAGEAVQ